MNSGLQKTILILSANPKDTPRLRSDEEIRKIEEAIRDSDSPNLFELKTILATTVADLQILLLRHKPHIVHFCGHGETDGLLFEDTTGRKQQVPVEALAELFKLCGQSIECVVLNACFSQPQAEAIHQYIPCVIGMNHNIGDKAAMLFAAGFYTALGNGRSYRDAFEFGCNRIGLHNIPEDSTPVILLREDVVVSPISRINPYRGLFAFRAEDEPFFFGRDAYTTKLIEAVQTQSLTAVIGASGSGKSSLVYAGLIPALRRQGNWLITSFRPGDNPFQAVAKALIPYLYTDELDRLTQTKKLAAQLQSSEISLLDVITRIVEKDEKASRFLLFADQFEELYTLCQHENDRRLFLDKILQSSVAPSSICTIILTLRADFFGRALTYRPFADALQGKDFILGPMNLDELRETIVKPAEDLDVQIEDGLTDRILDAVGNEPGNLPLLEFALTELWKKQNNGVFTHITYDEIGGVEQALAAYAESAYTQLTVDEQSRVKHIFTQLVRPGEGTEDTRRVANLTDIGENNWELLRKLADVRLVVTGGNKEIGETVEVVHEALIQRWHRLRIWMDTAREFRMWQERLRAAMRQWEKNRYDNDALLRGGPLAEAENWLMGAEDILNPQEHEFIVNSIQLRDRQITARKKKRQQTAIGLATTFIIVMALIIFGFFQWSYTKKQRQFADAQKKQLVVSTLDKIDRVLSNVHEDVEIMSALGTAKTAVQLGTGVGGASDFLNFITQRRHRLLKFVMLLDIEGTCVVINMFNYEGNAVAANRDALGKNFYNESWFQLAMTGKDEVIVTDWQRFDKALLTTESAIYSMIFASPIVSVDGEILGVWADVIDWINIQQILEQVQIETLDGSASSESFLLLSDNDTIIAHSKSGELLYGKSLAKDLHQPELVKKIAVTEGVFDYSWNGKPKTITFFREKGYGKYPGKNWGYLLVTEN